MEGQFRVYHSSRKWKGHRFNGGGELVNLLETGPIVLTIGIRKTMGFWYQEVINNCLERHMTGDWGGLCYEDKQMNNDALEMERWEEVSDGLSSSYETGFGKMFSITELGNTAMIMSDLKTKRNTRYTGKKHRKPSKMICLD